MARIFAVLILALVLATLPTVGCATDDAEIESVTYMAGYKAQANLPNVGVYVAAEMGYFDEQRLDVEIRHTTSGENLTLMMAGDVDFTSTDANSVLARRADPGLPLVAIALLGQRGQQAFLSLTDSGFESPKDWEGHTFGYKFTVPPDYLALLTADGADRAKIEEVRVGFDPRVLTEGQVDVLAAFKSNEPNAIRNLGFEVTVFDAADYGVPTLGLNYVTREDVIEDRPQLVERFLKAVMKGLEFAADNESAALDVVLKYAPEEDREHMRFMMSTEFVDAVSPLTDANGLGWMTAAQWREFHDSLLSYGALSEPQDVESAFTDEFLSRIYRNGELEWP